MPHSPSYVSSSSNQVKVEQAADTDDKIQSLVKFVRGLQGVPHTTSTEAPSQETAQSLTPEVSWKPSIPNVPNHGSSQSGTSTPKVMPPPPPPKANEPAKEEDDKPIPIMMPPRISHGFFPPGPVPPRQNQNVPTKRSHSPPPLSKPQSYPPPSTYPNPLGARQSNQPLNPRQPFQQHQPTEPPKPLIPPQHQQPNGNKKRLSVGTGGWSYNRQNEGNQGKGGAGGGRNNFQQNRNNMGGQGDRRLSWNGPNNGPGQVWPEPSPTGPPPSRSGPGIWPEPPARYELQEEEYDPKNPMNGFAPPALGPPIGRDGPFPPPPPR